jgi:hypothetical protein
MVRSYTVHLGDSSAEFLRSTEQYNLRVELSNPLDP